MCVCAYTVHVQLENDLPEKTLTAHRACISIIGWMGPFVWKRPMTASVGLDREGGNSLLKFKETNTLNMSSMHHDLTKAQHAGLVNWVLFINTPFKVKD